MSTPSPSEYEADISDEQLLTRGTDMSVNSSFNSSDSSLHLLLKHCSEFRPSTFNFVLLLPLFTFVLYMGYQRSLSKSSHSDVFTYNVVALETLSILGFFCYCGGALADSMIAVLVGSCMFSITSAGQNLFHVLTCVERYLAVVHPVTYLGLRQSGGVRIRNISIGCVWLICFGTLSGFILLDRSFTGVAASCLLVFSLIVVSFCSLSVLCVLIGPGPGDVGGDRERVDQTKRRAFYTITVIMGALVLRFMGFQIGSMM
ncbi:uncharacterized protein LOC130164919 [Seriola aureovittata]|uniref:uncharacterized protein LOC130164919 n=1 Tax=Seriola aureovittata TaxID=2871759 RepID=UPI0024BD76B9|nr:uncharacterized protein LOC130164919 [Seriola aureovittata]